MEAKKRLKGTIGPFRKFMARQDETTWSSRGTILCQNNHKGRQCTDPQVFCLLKVTNLQWVKCGNPTTQPTKSNYKALEPDHLLVPARHDKGDGQDGHGNQLPFASVQSAGKNEKMCPAVIDFNCKTSRGKAHILNQMEATTAAAWGHLATVLISTNRSQEKSEKKNRRPPEGAPGTR